MQTPNRQETNKQSVHAKPRGELLLTQYLIKLLNKCHDRRTIMLQPTKGGQIIVSDVGENFKIHNRKCLGDVLRLVVGADCFIEWAILG